MTFTSIRVEQNTGRRWGIELKALNHLKVFPGYTLFTPLNGCGAVYLLDLKGQIVHKWKLPYAPGASSRFLSNGNLLYSGTLRAPQSFQDYL